MAKFQAQSGFTTDPETGCVQGYNDYEQCRANYFLKQQNQIIQQQKTTPAVSTATTTVTDTELEKLRTQIQEQKTEIESLKTQQTIPQQNFNNNPTASYPYPLIGVVAIIGLVVGVLLIKLLQLRK